MIVVFSYWLCARNRQKKPPRNSPCMRSIPTISTPAARNSGTFFSRQNRRQIASTGQSKPVYRQIVIPPAIVTGKIQ